MKQPIRIKFGTMLSQVRLRLTHMVILAAEKIRWKPPPRRRGSEKPRWYAPVDETSTHMDGGGLWWALFFGDEVDPPVDCHVREATLAARSKRSWRARGHSPPK